MLTLPAARGLVERLRKRRPGGTTKGPRIAVIGNCQAAAIARALRLLRPDGEIRFLSAGRLGRGRGRPDQLVTGLVGYDHVFAQRIATGHLRAEHYDALAENPGFRAVPAIVFAAFHPDLVYVGGPGTRHPAIVDSPIGHYHSAIALYGYLAGLSPRAALRLFTRQTYTDLGYLDLWGYSRDTLLQLGRESGLDLAPHLVAWTRRGCFMHSVNHPKMFVAADLARLLLDGSGLDYVDYDLDGYLVDDLALQGHWPVYEPIAQRFGVGGGTMFQAQILGRAGRRAPRILSLEAFVRESFALYRGQPRATLVSDRVESWLANDALGTALRARAG